jgi:hypothetical protein
MSAFHERYANAIMASRIEVIGRFQEDKLKDPAGEFSPALGG